MNTKDRQALATIVRQRRHYLGLPHRVLAIKVPCSIETIRAIEQGRESYCPSFDMLVRLAEKLEMPGEQLTQWLHHSNSPEPMTEPAPVPASNAVSANAPSVTSITNLSGLRFSWRLLIGVLLLVVLSAWGIWQVRRTNADLLYLGSLNMWGYCTQVLGGEKTMITQPSTAFSWRCQQGDSLLPIDPQQVCEWQYAGTVVPGTNSLASVKWIEAYPDSSKEMFSWSCFYRKP